MKFSGIGRITNDLVMSQGNQGSNYVRFSIAQNDKKNKEVSYFFNCTAFGKTAETIVKWAKKGGRIYVEGEITQDKKENVTYTNYLVYNIEIIDFADKNEQQFQQPQVSQQYQQQQFQQPVAPQYQQQYAPPQQQYAQSQQQFGGFQEDIPF
jgi:single-strand DNA-binding protein